MGKTRVYGKANDEIPEVEFDVAKLVQNAKAFGLKWTKNSNYRTKNGRSIYVSDGAAFCCAQGAAWLDDSTRGMKISTTANDSPEIYRDCNELEDYKLRGLGYRLAMR